MALSYGGVSLTIPTPKVAAWLSATFPLRRLWEFYRLYWPGRLAWLAFPGQMPDAPLKLDCLHWPRGASRFSTFYAVVSDNVLAAIRAAGAPSSKLSLSLVWDDALAGASPANVTVPMWMLPALPLAQIGGQNGLNLLTLVDDRFWWWFRAEGNVTVTEGTTTWDQLYTALSGPLGVVFSWDGINAAYLKPPKAFGTSYEYIPLLLDAVAYNVGQRIVANLDGTFKARGVANGAGDVATSLGLPSARSLMAGGVFLAADVLAAVPSTADVAFPQTTGGVLQPTPHVVTGQTTGGTAVAVKSFHDSAVYDGTNAAQLVTLAAQIAADYGASMTQLGDWKFCGIVPWQPDPLHDAVEWVITGEGGPLGRGEASTRVIPAAWNDLTDSLSHAGSAGSATPGGLEVVNTDGTQITQPTSVIQAHNDQGTAAFGRIYTTAEGNGVAQLDWQGLRLYEGGTGYVGPEPDIEFVAGAGVTIVIADDPADKRVKATISATGSTGAVEVKNTDGTQDTNPASVIKPHNDQGSHAFGRLYTTALGGGVAQLDWQGLRLYLSGTGYVGPEPDVEVINGFGIAFTIADDVADQRVQVTAAVSLPSGFASLATTYTIGSTAFVATGLSITLPDNGTYLLWAVANAEVLTDASGGTQSVQLQLWDSTAGVAVGAQIEAAWATGSAVLDHGIGVITARYAPGGVNHVIQLRASWATAGTTNTAAASVLATGGTTAPASTLMYLRTI